VGLFAFCGGGSVADMSLAKNLGGRVRVKRMPF